jgi:hypothetical protein
MSAGGRLSRGLGWGLLAWGLVGCAGTVRVAVSLKSCPEVTELVGKAVPDLQRTLGIDAGDAATLTAGFDASKQIAAHLEEVDGKLKSACSSLASALGSPITASTVDEACQQASRVESARRTQLGADAKVAAQHITQCSPGCTSVCDAASPSGPCAQSTVSVSVTGASDEDAAAHYRTAVEAFLAASIAARAAESNGRALITNARTAVELGIATGHAVSDGDIAGAIGAAVCILPPLIQAKQRIAALRKDYRIGS